MISYLYWLMGYETEEEKKEREDKEAIEAIKKENEVWIKSITKYVEPTAWSPKCFNYYFPGQQPF